MTHANTKTRIKRWNWEQPDWPHFKFHAADLEQFEEQFLIESGLLLGSLEHIDEQETTHLRVEIITHEALKTSEIEGEHLNRDSLQSSIRRHFGLQTDGSDVPAAEKGIADMMIDLYQHFSEKLTHKLLYKWHEMMMSGRVDLQDIGHYRTSTEPMQVVSGPMNNPKVHFEAPASEQMQAEMRDFIKWFNDSGAQDKTPLPSITRAGITHLYFVSIHPFEDGNGRAARALSEKALAQSLGRPTLTALSMFIEEHRKDYYDALKRASKTNEITEWLVYFGNVVTGAQQHSQQLVSFLIQKTKLFNRLGDQLNKRQEKVLLRMFKEGPRGFKGGLSAGNYINITRTTRQTATRDLGDLVRKGALIKKGEKRYARYYLNLPS